MSNTELKHTQLYRSIETLPIWNFKKIQEKKDLRYLYKLDDYENIQQTSEGLQEIWDDIYFQWLDEFGEPSQAAEFRRTKTMYWLSFWKLVATGDNSIKNELNIYENKLKRIQGENNKIGKFSKEVEAVERHRNIVLDVFTIPVIKWYRYVEALEQEIKETKIKQKNGRR